MPDHKLNLKTRRGKKTIGWVIARKVTQFISFTVFLASVWLTQQYGLAPGVIDLSVRISPLAMLANLLSSKTFLTGSTISLILLGSSFIFGRAWCGWLCPVGTLLDVFRFKTKKDKKDLPQNLRAIKYGVLIFLLVSAIFGNLTFIFLDPLTLFFRTTTLVILPGLDKIIFALEKILIRVPWLARPVSDFDSWLRPAVFPAISISFQYAVVVGGFFLVIVLLNLIAERFWCRYLCPLGALLGLPSKLALFQRKTGETCSACGLCAKRCPTATIDARRNYASDPSECTLCLNCVEDCNQKANSFRPAWKPAVWQDYDPDRRKFLSATGLSLTSVVLLNIDWKKNKQKDFQLLPPGVEDADDFLSKCVRCGICLKICPTNALQVDMQQAGLEGIWSPLIVPRIGFCGYSCTLCGEYCPVEAIPRLPLEVKQQTPIGRAYIDHNRCIAWSDHTNCIVCEEMCPLPQKAITLEKTSFDTPDRGVVDVLLPIVDRNRCIGCGTCENKCPLDGEAAIRVYSI